MGLQDLIDLDLNSCQKSLFSFQPSANKSPRQSSTESRHRVPSLQVIYRRDWKCLKVCWHFIALKSNISHFDFPCPKPIDGFVEACFRSFSPIKNPNFPPPARSSWLAQDIILAASTTSTCRNSSQSKSIFFSVFFRWKILPEKCEQDRWRFLVLLRDEKRGRKAN